MALLEHELTRAVIDAFFRVYSRLGYGFLESVYANALALELQQVGRVVQREAPIAVIYDGVAIGNYRPISSSTPSSSSRPKRKGALPGLNGNS